MFIATQISDLELPSNSMSQDNNPKRPRDDLNGAKDDDEGYTISPPAKRLRISTEEDVDATVEDEISQVQQGSEGATQPGGDSTPPASASPDLSNDAAEEDEERLSDVDVDLDDLISVHEEDIEGLSAAFSIVNEEVDDIANDATNDDDFASLFPRLMLGLGHTTAPSRTMDHPFSPRRLRTRRRALRRWFSCHRGREYFYRTTSDSPEVSDEEW